MTPEKAALIILSLGLITALIWWWVFRPRSGGRDVGLAVFHEDEMDDRHVAITDALLAATTDRAEQDALLDVRLRAMGGAG